MKNIIDKLSSIDDGEGNPWKRWTLEEKKQLLDIYLIICKNEKHIFDLVYGYHGTDAWEDIFRDYDEQHFEDKISGVEMAISEITEINDT